MNKYIHYGSNQFNKDKFQEIKNMEMNKPQGGLWASNTESKYGWKDWCLDNDFYIEKLDNYYEFTLSNTAKILEIHSVSDLIKIPQQNKPDWYKHCIPDFEAIKEKYDAIEFFLSDEPNLYFELYGWDCDSILILNPDIIKIL